GLRAREHGRQHGRGDVPQCEPAGRPPRGPGRRGRESRVHAPRRPGLRGGEHVSILSTYSFLPRLRQGPGGQITADAGATSVAGRATVRVRLEIAGEDRAGAAFGAFPVGKDVELYGPGDVVGIDSRAVVRTDPRHWITNAEPNYLTHVELTDPDMP